MTTLLAILMNLRALKYYCSQTGNVAFQLHQITDKLPSNVAGQPLAASGLGPTDTVSEEQDSTQSPNEDHSSTNLPKMRTSPTSAGSTTQALGNLAKTSPPNPGRTLLTNYRSLEWQTNH